MKQILSLLLLLVSIARNVTALPPVVYLLLSDDATTGSGSSATSAASKPPPGVIMSSRVCVRKPVKLNPDSLPVDVEYAITSLAGPPPRPANNRAASSAHAYDTVLLPSFTGVRLPSGATRTVSTCPFIEMLSIFHTSVAASGISRKDTRSSAQGSGVRC